MPSDIKEARILNQIEIQRVLNDLISCSREDLKNKLADVKSSMLTLIVGSILTNAANKGDPVRLNFILDRLIGKAKETIDITATVSQNDPELKQKMMKIVANSSLLDDLRKQIVDGASQSEKDQKQ